MKHYKYILRHKIILNFSIFTETQNHNNQSTIRSHIPISFQNLPPFDLKKKHDLKKSENHRNNFRKNKYPRKHPESAKIKNTTRIRKFNFYEHKKRMDDEDL